MEKARKSRVKKDDIGYGYYSTFPSQLRKLLDKPDMTQEKLAVALDISRQSVAQWKDGKTMPDIYYLKKIADFFDVPYEYLLDGVQSEKKENIEINKRLNLSDSAIEALKNFTHVPASIEIINFLLASDTFSKFIDTLYDQFRQEHYLANEQYRKEALPESTQILAAIEIDDLKQIHITKIRGLAEQIMKEYIAQPNPAATESSKAILAFYGWGEQAKKLPGLESSQPAEEGDGNG